MQILNCWLAFFITKPRRDLVKRPKYAHLYYDVLHELDISIAEYFLMDMIYQLCRGGWSRKRLEYIAQDMNISRLGVMKMRDRLITKGLLEKGVGSRLKTTEKVNKVYFSQEDYKKSIQSYKKVNKVYKKSIQSIPPSKINYRLTKNNREEKGKGYELAAEVVKRIRLKAQS